MDREDGEMSDDSTMLVDDDAGETAPETKSTTMLYKTEKHGIVLESLEKVDASKLEERAQRFGLCLTGNKVITQKQIDELYENFGIESGNERHFRFDSLHLSGVGGLKTKEIFQYLNDYKPLSLEWIDHVSCNVVCQDHLSAALALLIHSREIEDNDLKMMLAEKSDHHWREGVSNKENLILMRFATNGDKRIVKNKIESNDHEYFHDNIDSVIKNPWGDLCKSWGINDHQEVFHRKIMNIDDDNTQIPQKYVPIKNKRLAMRLGKRTIDIRHSDNSEDSSSDTEWKIKSKTPRMRMHADDEEEKLKKKYISKVPKEEAIGKEQYALLSIEIVNSSTQQSKQREYTKLSDKFKYHNTKEQKHGIQSRLGEKVDSTLDNGSSDESASSRHSDSNIMSKVEKIKKSKASNNIWSRLEIKQPNTNVHSDLRDKIKSKKQEKPNNIRDRIGQTDDLRERLGKTKHSNLRIEIDNSR